MQLHQIDERICSDPCAGPCSGCPDRVVCHCFKVTEETVVAAIRRHGLVTVREVRQMTEAGDGCTCCHAEIRELIEIHAESPVKKAEFQVA